MSNVVPSTWDVPAVFRGRLGTRAGRQRAMHHDGHLLLILHEVPSTDDMAERGARLYWRKPDGTWRSTGSSVATIAPLRALVEEFAAATEAMDRRADTAERASEWFALIHESAPLLRTVRGLAATLQEGRDVAKPDRDLIALRDQAQEIERSVELVHGHARSGLDFAIARSAEDNAHHARHSADAGHRLNLLAATFLPISAIGSLMSINLEHGLERWNSPWAFWIVAVIAFVLGFAIRASLPKPLPPQ
jgi:hypothetical protein